MTKLKETLPLKTCYTGGCFVVCFDFFIHCGVQEKNKEATVECCTNLCGSTIDFLNYSNKMDNDIYFEFLAIRLIYLRNNCDKYINLLSNQV